MRSKLCVALALTSFLNGAALAQSPVPSRQDIETIVAEYIKTHPDELGTVVKDYVVKHPEILREIFLAIAANKMQSKAGDNAQSAAAAEKLARKRAETVTANAELLFVSPRQTTLGNASGDVTLVEFFDYNCGFCKRALGDLVNLLAEDAKLKVALKEFPVLGPRSMDSLVAVAVRMQDPSGVKYLAFHRQLLGSHEAANRERALAVASELGLDRSRLERDMASEEAHATIAENEQLAAALHISGTPAYVVGTNVFTGAIGEHALKEQIDAVRNNHNQ